MWSLSSRRRVSDDRIKSPELPWNPLIWALWLLAPESDFLQG
jgi:hypothetical protein